MTYAPGFIAIGDDGGGRAFVLRLGEADPTVYAVYYGLMSSEEMEVVALRFEEWWRDIG